MKRVPIQFQVKYVPDVTKNMKLTVLLSLLGQARSQTKERRQPPDPGGGGGEDLCFYLVILPTLLVNNEELT